MADQRPPADRLPIKIILPGQGSSKRGSNTARDGEPFREVDQEFRNSLSAQVGAIARGLAVALDEVGAAPIRVQLIPKAFAKSHRPRALFSERTCPIVGAGRLGELFLKATPAGLANLQRTIEGNESKRMLKQLSTVQSIEAVTPSVRRKRKTAAEVQQASPRIDDEFFLTRVHLFEFGGTDQERIEESFRQTCRERRLPFSSGGYGADGLVYAVPCRSDLDVEVLSRIIGVRSVIGMPLMHTIRAEAFNATAVPADLPRPADVEGGYPVVAVVDSGIRATQPALAGWVEGEESYVATPYRNPAHGTFVAGLIVHGEKLNPQLPDLCQGPCGVFDVQVLPNTNPDQGDVEYLTESQFLVALEDALEKHADRYKVWNLSLSSDEPCSEDDFSLLAVELDDLQERHQVTFVIAAGNYDTRPLLPYPRAGQDLQRGRITAPADSVLGVTVGSISHVDYPDDRGPSQNEASPFSRHGAGPNYVIKPDMVHYGGTCTIDGGHQSGVRSLTDGGAGEALGTSYATPIVARSLAQIYHQVTPEPNPVLARALLTHHARDPRSGHRVPDGEEDFLGFGRPAPPPYCLECSPHEATLIFNDTLTPGYFLEWDDFPYPPSLMRDGLYYGHIAMTVAFAPTRGARWGVEYCETHIDAKFGTYVTKTQKDSTTKEEFGSLAPPEHRNPGTLYEETQVRELRKWAPVRTFFGDLGPGGARGNRWRLKVSLLSRHDGELDRVPDEQPFALILTISDPEGTAPVYDEMAQLIRARYQAENLALRVGARIRTKT